MTSNATDSRPPLLSAKSHSLSTAYYLQRILGEVQECVNDVKSLDISSEINQSLKSLLESIRSKFEDVLTSHWLRGKNIDFFSRVCSTESISDTNLFYHLESWTLNPDEPSVTSYLAHFELFQRHMTVAAYNLAAGAIESTPSSSPTTLTMNQKPFLSRRKSAVPPTLASKITRAFMDALYAFLDGLVVLAGEESPIVLKPAEVQQQQQPKWTESAIETRLHDSLDLKDPVSGSCSQFSHPLC